MASQNNDKLAVLIDADIAQASVIHELLAEVSRYGTASVKRAYGDWTTTNLKGWKDVLHKMAIQPMQQFSYTTGKNSSDARLSSLMPWTCSTRVAFMVSALFHLTATSRASPLASGPLDLEREPEAPSQDDHDTNTVPAYSPTKPIVSGMDRYKRVGNREFVQYSDGSIDFGQISPDIVESIQEEKGVQIEVAPIRLGRGRSRHEGELHLERGGKAKELHDAGYASAAELVDDAGNHFTEVWQGEGETLLLVKRSPDKSSPMIYVEIRKPLTGQYV